LALMHLGVVIVSYHVRELLRGCLASLFADQARSAGLKMTVVVVDNASTDGSPEMVRAEFPQVNLIASEENLGFARGNNVGLRALGFDIASPPSSRPNAVFLLNPDTELQAGALAALIGFLQDHPQAGGCCPRLNYGDGRFQHSAFMFPGLMQLFLDLFPLHPRLLETRINGRYPRKRYERGHPFPIDFALGAALMVRAEVIDEVGLLDEGYFMYAEEMDWQRRIQNHGWPLYCVPTARITHYEGQSARQFRGAATLALWRSRIRYYDKHYAHWKRRAAHILLKWGMNAKMRQAQEAFDRGDISRAELDEQLTVYRQVLALLPE
ncbi:MAG: glycosyltransferase family 2 protein, partial [Chloroflexi bacterium]|nr:glycosyltransferase family 2 protein [Chloroflexota bacterium]